MSDNPASPDALTEHGSPDPLTGHSTGAGVWSLPSDEGAPGQVPPNVPPDVPVLFDYSRGILVGPETDADAVASEARRLIPARVDAPASFDLPHPATHRRYEPLRIQLVSQGAAGTTMLVPALQLHYIKLIAANITLDAGGTFKWVQGDFGGTSVADMTGAMNMGGAAVPPLNLPPSPLENPWLFTSNELALGITTGTGKAQGWFTYVYSPYDA